MNLLSFRNRAIADYLRSNGYEEAYSVFKKEAELDMVCLTFYSYSCSWWVDFIEVLVVSSHLSYLKSCHLLWFYLALNLKFTHQHTPSLYNQIILVMFGLRDWMVCMAWAFVFEPFFLSFFLNLLFFFFSLEWRIR